MNSKIVDAVIGFRGGRWTDEEQAREIIGIVSQHLVAEIDKRIAREQMGGDFGVVVDSLESLRQWATPTPDATITSTVERKP